MKRLATGLTVLAFALTGCSKITMLRTEEMQSVGNDVQVSVLSNLDTAVQELSAQNDSLRMLIDSLEARLDASALVQKRMMAEITTLSRRMGDESERNDSRQEEIIYRLDMLLGKSDKILAKKVVVSGAAQAPMSMDSLELEAEKLVEAEAMFNTARSDYHRGEYKLAYAGFKQVYEQMKTGELAENSLYWMALCLIDVNQVEKAKKVFSSLADAFPDGQKTCTTMFKLAAIYKAECNIDMQKQYLQKILNSKTCAASGEFEQAAEILQEILEMEEKKAAGEPVETCTVTVVGPAPENQSNAPQADSTAAANAAAPADSANVAAPAAPTPAPANAAPASAKPAEAAPASVQPAAKPAAAPAP